MTILADQPVLPPGDPVGRQELADLAALIAEADGSAALVGSGGVVVQLPPAVYNVLVRTIWAMLEGRAITIAPLAQRLTTQEAADLLGVSRPTVVKLLEDGKLPFEQPGRHRRIRLDDLLAYQSRRRVERSATLDELVRQTEELGLYADTPEETG